MATLPVAEQVIEDPTHAAFELRIPPPKTLTLSEQLTLLRAAWARQPESTVLRLALARLLLQQNLFAEAGTLLNSWADDSFAFQVLEIEVNMSLETEAGNFRVERLCTRILEQSTDAEEQTIALTNLGLGEPIGPIPTISAGALLATHCFRRERIRRIPNHPERLLLLERIAASLPLAGAPALSPIRPPESN